MHAWWHCYFASTGIDKGSIITANFLLSCNCRTYVSLLPLLLPPNFPGCDCTSTGKSDYPSVLKNRNPGNTTERLCLNVEIPAFYNVPKSVGFPNCLSIPQKGIRGIRQVMGQNAPLPYFLKSMGFHKFERQQNWPTVFYGMSLLYRFLFLVCLSYQLALAILCTQKPLI